MLVKSTPRVRTKQLFTALTSTAPPLRLDHVSCLPQPFRSRGKTQKQSSPEPTSPVRAERFIPPDMSAVVRFGQRRTDSGISPVGRRAYKPWLDSGRSEERRVGKEC